MLRVFLHDQKVRKVLDSSCFRGGEQGRERSSVARMNLSEHVHVTWALHVEMSVTDRPDLTRVIGVPRDAPSYWIVEAYRLSLGLEPETPDSEDGPDHSPLIDLVSWRGNTQRVSIPGVADVVDVTISGPFETTMGEPRVTVVDAGRVQAEEQTEAAGWQVQRPPFRAEHVAFELAQRFGLVQPRLDPIAASERGDGLRASSSLVTLCESLTPVRRLALLAHLEGTGLIDAAPPGQVAADSATVESATAGLRGLVARIGPDGVEQDPVAGWLPRAAVAEAVEDLGWHDAEASDVPDPVDALALLARQTKAVRRLRGRIVVTHLGHALANGEARGFLRVVGVVRAHGKERLFPHGQLPAVTLALLAVADGSVMAFDELPETVTRGEAAVDEGRGHGGRFSEWSLRSHREGDAERGSGDRYAVRRVVESLCALSSPGAFASITPAMRAVAGAALW